MSRLALFPIAFLICSSLAAADIVSPELPVADLRLVPDPNTSCSVVSGERTAYALCNSGGKMLDRIELDAEGKPDLATRAPFLPSGGSRAIAGEAIFYKVDDAAFACGCLADRVTISTDFELPTIHIAAAASRDRIAVAYYRWVGNALRVFVRVVRPPRRRAAAR